MIFPDNRGRLQAETAMKNRKRIITFFKCNPEATQRECSATLGLGISTVEKHVQYMRKHGIPEELK